MAQTIVLRGRVLSFPAAREAPPLYIADGLITIENGIIRNVGPAQSLLPQLAPGTPIEHHGDGLILPGFIDPHIHYPQCGVIASYGAQLIDWLNRFTFPAEQAFADPAIAAAGATFFFDEMLRNGTTTACVYCTVHPQSVDAFFEESERRGTRMIAGKVMMDRNAPAGLRDDAETSFRDSESLLQKWHARGRQLYAITPRFAITSTEAQLAAAGALYKANPDAYLQTHLAENHAEIAAVRALFPEDPSYTAVYARHNLLGPHTLLGHCIHLSDAELQLISDKQSVAVFCPTSNLFLGSGLFDRARYAARSLRTGLATDVGGGTSYSMLRTAAEAYKILQLQGQNFPAFDAFRTITRGNAEILSLDHRIGAIEPGYEADLVVLNSNATTAMRHRRAAIGDSLQDELFLLMTLGDDRAISATYVAGKRVQVAQTASAP